MNPRTSYEQMIRTVTALRHRSLLCGSSLLLAALGGCASEPPPLEDPELVLQVEPEAEEETQTPLQRAEALFGSGDLSGARAALDEHLADEPEDAQARYLMARTLGLLGELRAARRELHQVLGAQPENALAWDLLGNVQEQLGNHRAAIEAYLQVRERTDSLAPLLGLARCYLYLGEPNLALATLEEARARPAKVPWTELLRFQALRRLERPHDAEAAARAYLLAVKPNDPAHTEHVQEAKRWLAERAAPLDPVVRRTMVDYVRDCTRLRLPNSAPPGEEILARAPERLLVHDDRPVFVTVFPPKSSLRFRGRGRGRNLASALKGAVEQVREHPAYAPLLAREAAVRVAIGHGLEPVELRDGADGLRAAPPLVLGRHGLALRVDGQEAFCLPGDPLSEDLRRLEDLLEHASREAGLAPNAWQSASQAIYRFRCESFVSPAPGAAPRGQRDAEPLPLPRARPKSLRAAAHAGARWLSTMLQPDGSVALAYSPPRNANDSRADDAEAVLLSSPEVAARAAELCARLHHLLRDPVMAAAARHLAELLRQRPALSPAAGARLERCLSFLGEPAQVDLPKTLAGARGPERATAALALLGRDVPAAHREAEELLEALGAEGLVTAADGLAAVLSLAQRRPEAPLVERVLARSLATLSEPAQAEEGGANPAREPEAGDDPPAAEAARALRAAAELARLAQLSGHPRAQELRTRALEHAEPLLALQLGERHRFLCQEPGRALGGFRDQLGTSQLRAETTVRCLDALAACLELLE